MNWKDAMSHELPHHEETVMIAIDGMNCVATYDADEKGFRLSESKKLVWIEQGGANIQWQRMQTATSGQA